MVTYDHKVTLRVKLAFNASSMKILHVLRNGFIQQLVQYGFLKCWTLVFFNSNLNNFFRFFSYFQCRSLTVLSSVNYRLSRRWLRRIVNWTCIWIDFVYIYRRIWAIDICRFWPFVTFSIKRSLPGFWNWWCHICSMRPKFNYSRPILAHIWPQFSCILPQFINMSIFDSIWAKFTKIISKFANRRVICTRDLSQLAGICSNFTGLRPIFLISWPTIFSAYIVFLSYFTTFLSIFTSTRPIISACLFNRATFGGWWKSSITTWRCETCLKWDGFWWKIQTIIMYRL